MPFLAGENLTKFTKYLSETQYADEVNNGILTEWERGFVADLQARFDGREEAEDLGIPVWQPSLNQWNTLHGIWSKL